MMREINILIAKLQKMVMNISYSDFNENISYYPSDAYSNEYPPDLYPFNENYSPYLPPLRNYNQGYSSYFSPYCGCNTFY